MRLEAAAKNSSEEARMRELRDEERRSVVVVAKVGVMRSEGMVSVGGGGSGRVSWIVSGERAWISMIENQRNEG